MKKNLKLLLGFIIISFLFQSCELEKNKFDVKEITLPNGDVVIKISKDNVILCTIDFDKNRRIKSVSNDKTDVIYFKELVYQINNRPSKTDSTLYTLNHENIDIMVDKYRDKVRSRTIVQDILFTPRINHYTARLGSEYGWFLSEYRGFEFRTGKLEKEKLEYVILLNDLEKLQFRKGVQCDLRFEVLADHSSFRLLRGKFDKNFNALGEVDTIKINNFFTTQYTPSQNDKDTIRFIVLNENLKDGMHKSFYYEFPIVVR